MPKVTANGIKIEYETFGDPAHPAMLLIMGLGMQPPAFVAGERRADDQFGRLQQIAQLDQIGRNAEASATITAARQFPSRASSTKTTNSAPSVRFFSTVWMVRFTRSLRS